MVTNSRRSLGPVRDAQSRYGGQVAVFGHDHTISEARGNRGDLHIDLLHLAARPSQLSENASVLPGGVLIERPDNEIAELVPKSLFVALSRLTEFNARPEFCQHRHRDADSVTVGDSFSRSFVDTTATVYVIARDSRVQKKAGQKSPSSSLAFFPQESALNDRELARALSISSCSPASSDRGSTTSIRCNNAWIPCGVFGHSDSSIPTRSFTSATRIRVPSGHSTGVSKMTLPSRYVVGTFAIITFNRIFR